MATTATKPITSDVGTRDRIIQFLAQSWSYIFLVGVFVFFSRQGTNFFTVGNISQILVNSTLVLLMALGQTYVIITAGIDLSIAWTVGLASVVSARAMRDLMNGAPLLGGTPMGLPPALLIGIILGLGVTVIPGLVNGILIARIKVPPFIATLGMYGVIRGIAFLLTDGQQVVANLPVNLREFLRAFGNGSLLYNIPGLGLTWFSQPADLTSDQLRNIDRLLPYPVLVTALVVIIFGFVLSRTKFGRHTYAIGGSQDAAIRSGVNVQRHLIMIYIISALAAGVAGLLYLTRFTAGAPQAGEASLLDSVAAVVIGGTSLLGGAGTIRGAVVGALIIGVLKTGLINLNVNSLWQFVVVGMVIIVAVIVNQAQVLLERQKSHG
jgi:ribose transport system permease protein